MSSQSTIAVSFSFSNNDNIMSLMKFEEKFDEAEVNKLIKRFDPDYITKELQITPTETWRAGDKYPDDFPRYRLYDHWALSSKAKTFRSFNEPLEIVLKQLHPKAEKIKEVSRKLGIKYSLFCSFTLKAEWWPVVHVKSRLLKQMADLDVDLLAAFYELPGDCESCGSDAEDPGEEE